MTKEAIELLLEIFDFTIMLHVNIYFIMCDILQAKTLAIFSFGDFHLTIQYMYNLQRVTYMYI